MVRWLAYVFAAVFLFIGIAGFVPAAFKDGLLFGLFAVNFWHNIIHIVSGIAAAAAGFAGFWWSRVYFQVLAVVYLATAIMGLVMGDGLMLGLVANNMADVILHFVLGGAAAYIGFGCGWCGTCCGKKRLDNVEKDNERER
ncbi:MAG: DUF4383 domain-containing protein [Chlamydiales bacterium]|nr:DUF4383 domain-containing protein [Chlamydiales bacterium]